MTNSKTEPQAFSTSASGTSGTASNVITDRLFADASTDLADFSFDERTAAVFDDMVARSVPLYVEMQRLAGELASDFAVEGTHLYDLGCATGTTLCKLHDFVPAGVRFVGVDNSADMLNKAALKLRSSGIQREHELILADLHNQDVVHNASVVVMILTLQFIRPLYRERLMQRLFEGMNDNGALIIFEKVTVKDSLFNRLFIQHYYEMKRRNGYSEVEIANKREALENVLIPFRPEENMELLNSVGFKQCEEFFRWYNFTGIIAVK